MRFVSLKITAQGDTGWESPLLKFGQRTTSLFAKNGSGKTPLIHALAFCLGYPVTFRDDINNKCKSAVLTIEQDGKPVALERFLGKDFVARITYATGGALEYFSALDYSNELFKLLGMEVPALVSTTRTVTQPYLETVLPIFYLNQDIGYSILTSPIAPLYPISSLRWFDSCSDSRHATRSRHKRI